MIYNNDRSFWWRPGRIYIPHWSFTGLDYEATTAIDIKSIGPGAANDTANVEVAASGITGLQMSAAGNGVCHLMMVPPDWDLQYPTYFRVWWSGGSITTADTIDWIVTYLAIVKDVTAIALPSTALDVVVPQDTVPTTTADTLNATEFGRMNGGKLGENVEALGLQVEMDAFAAGFTESKRFHGLEMRYTPKRLYYGDGMYHEAKSPTFVLGKTYS
jgi:hypothetical protein